MQVTDEESPFIMDHDTQEGILSFPFDHLYACHTENVDVAGDSILQNIQNEQAQNEIIQLTTKLNNVQKENCRLKDLIQIHLDLIQQQSDELTQKEKEITSLQRANEKLKSANQAEGSLNYRIQKLNPPPLTYLTSNQPTSTVTILPETSQVQFTNLTGIISPTGTVENIITKKTYDKKPEINETFTWHSTLQNKDGSLPFTNVGSLIDTRYLQCTDGTFDNSQSICIQPVMQPIKPPVLQSTLQPMVQSMVSPCFRKPIQQTRPQTISVPANRINSFKTIPIPIQMNKIATRIPISTFEDKKIKIKTTDFFGPKETITKLPEISSLNKKCKTIFTYEKSPKKHIKKCGKTFGHIQSYEPFNKSPKGKEQLKLFSGITEDKPSTIGSCKFTNINQSINSIKPKPVFNKFPSFTETKPMVKTNQPPSFTITRETPSTSTATNTITKDAKVPQPRKFFTSSYKEKASCRDFSYGETFSNNQKYNVKPDILEYLEGNNLSVQSDIEIMDPNLNIQEEKTWKDSYNPISKFFNSSPTPSSTLLTIPDNSIIEENNLLDLKPRDESEKTIILNEPMDEIEKIDLYEFPSSEEYDNNQLNLVFMNNFLSDNGNMTNCTKSAKKRNFRTTSMCLPSQSTDTPMGSQLVAYKSNANRKKSVRRKRALSSASKVSCVSHGESPLPYSWAFSGLDFKMLLEDIKSSYFIATFGPNQTYFTIENVSLSHNEQNAPETTSLEVPSWRIKYYSPMQCSQSNENMDEELFLKRHLKMEIEEKRRKRWDFQMIREQRHIEKLKQRQERRNSGGFKHSRNSKCITGNFNEELPSTLYPSPDDILAIEITDMLPVTAFGECIPDLPPRPFQLPWIRPCSHSHSRTHQSSKKRIRVERSEEE